MDDRNVQGMVLRKEMMVLLLKGSFITTRGAHWGGMFEVYPCPEADIIVILHIDLVEP